MSNESEPYLHYCRFRAHSRKILLDILVEVITIALLIALLKVSLALKSKFPCGNFGGLDDGETPNHPQFIIGPGDDYQLHVGQLLGQ
jgi:hypothetical protein